VVEAAELLTDPAIPADQKRYMLNYLRWLRASGGANPGWYDDGEPPRRALGT